MLLDSLWTQFNHNVATEPAAECSCAALASVWFKLCYCDPLKGEGWVTMFFFFTCVGVCLLSYSSEMKNIIKTVQNSSLDVPYIHIQLTFEATWIQDGGCSQSSRLKKNVLNSLKFKSCWCKTGCGSSWNKSPTQVLSKPFKYEKRFSCYSSWLKRS